MLRFLTFMAPFLLKGASKRPIRVLMGRSAVYSLGVLSAIFLLAALFVYVFKTISLEAAFLSVAAILITTAIAIKIWVELQTPRKAQNSLPASMENDTLASFIPDSVAGDPLIQKILKEIGNNPIPATATAVTVGMLLSREYFDGD